MVFFVIFLICNFACIISYFIRIILVFIFFLLKIWLSRFGCINLSSWCKVFWYFLVMGALITPDALVFFALFTGFSNNFNRQRLKSSWFCFYISPRLRFLSFMIFSKNFIIANISFATFCGLFAVSNPLVYFSNHWRELKTSFSFGFNDFLY